MIFELVAGVEMFLLIGFISYYFGNIEVGLRKAFLREKFVKIWGVTPPGVWREFTRKIDKNGAVVFNNQCVKTHGANTHVLRRKLFSDEALLIVPYGEPPVQLGEFADIVKKTIDDVENGEVLTLDDAIGSVEILKTRKSCDKTKECLDVIYNYITRSTQPIIISSDSFLARGGRYRLVDTVETNKMYNNKILQAIYRVRDLPLIIFCLIMIGINLVLSFLIFNNTSGVFPTP